MKVQGRYPPRATVASSNVCRAKETPKKKSITSCGYFPGNKVTALYSTARWINAGADVQSISQIPQALSFVRNSSGSVAANGDDLTVRYSWVILT